MGNIKEVVLESNCQLHYVKIGRISGQAVNFILDTGASDLVVPQELARKLGLEFGYA